MKYLCVNNRSIELDVAKGYPLGPPPNGRMELMLLKKIKMAQFATPKLLKAPGTPIDGQRFSMEVGEIYEATAEKISYYGIPLLYFDGFYGWRPKCCFMGFEPEEAQAVNESELGFSISLS